jgi:hypothetical protein
MDIYAAHDRLVRLITDAGGRARDCRQIAQRLRQLLPARMDELMHRLRNSGESVTLARRKALASGDFVGMVDELMDAQGQALEARIQFETHLMLVEARKSLRRNRLTRSGRV